MRALAFFLFSACLTTPARPNAPMAPGPAQTAQQRTADDEIYDKVRQRLANDRDVKGGGLDVEVHQGVVTLRGKVREARQKTKAENLTRKVKGVKKVVNELVVEMPTR